MGVRISGQGRLASGLAPDATGVPQVLPTLRLPAHMGIGNITANSPLGNTQFYAYYYGRAGAALSSVGVRFELSVVGNLGAAPTRWAEVGLAKGAPVLGGPTPLTMLGWADLYATVNTPAALGVKNVTVALSTPAAPADDLWLCWAANAATTAPEIRAGLYTDRAQAFHLEAVAGSLRPSTFVAGTAINQAANSVTKWAVLVVS